MPIYEFYSPDTNKIYSFFAKTLAQGKRIPQCPDDPRARMMKLVSGFAIGGRNRDEPATSPGSPGPDTPPDLTDAQMAWLERQVGEVDENDPKALARVLRRVTEMGGGKLDEPMEAALRKLEEGVDPESLEEELGGAFPDDEAADSSGASGQPAPKGGKAREARAKRVVRRPPAVRDPQLYDYD